MQEILDLLTLEWFLSRAILGVLFACAFRIFEHISWSKGVPAKDNPHGNLGFAKMALPQCFIMGLGIGYILVAVVALNFKNRTVVEVSAYLIPAVVSFVASDLRDLLRRISRM